MDLTPQDTLDLLETYRSPLRFGGGSVPSLVGSDVWQDVASSLLHTLVTCVDSRFQLPLAS